jgi:hypothetical protein
MINSQLALADIALAVDLRSNLRSPAPSNEFTGLVRGTCDGEILPEVAEGLAIQEITT